MSGWKEFEAARQRREDLLREARRERMARVARSGKRAGEPLRRRVLGLLGLGGERWICWPAESETSRCPAVRDARKTVR